jgi:hypothetical protein
MDKTEMEKLATTTVQWLTLKRRIGLAELFSESHLIIPVAEYLIAQGWDKLRAEHDSKKLFGKCNGGDVNYDLCATKSGKKLLVEMKLLKKAPRPCTHKPTAKCRLGWAAQCLLSGVKRTFLFAVRMSAFDPKRTSASVQRAPRL